ncbi:MAG: signal peptidase II [Spirochaetes bacterium]|nr:signal peptidase II [Spirochaetota bacterium]
MKRRKLVTFILVSIGVIGIDRLTKWLIKTTMELGESIPVLGDFFRISFILNSGIAFGLFDENPSPVKIPLLVFVSVVALGIILYIFLTLPKGIRLSGISMGLIFGGAIGNMIDRILRGRVVDFIDVDFFDIALPQINVFMTRFPTFNAADSSVFIGILMLLVIIIIQGGKAEART